MIQANGNNGPGGNVALQAQQQLRVSSQIQANGSTGGVISLTAPDSNGVVAIQHSNIQANGSTGRGGTVSIGASVNTSVANSAIIADGVQQGGKVLIGNDAQQSTLPFSLVTSLDAATSVSTQASSTQVCKARMATSSD
jgi:hypothetical protein